MWVSGKRLKSMEKRIADLEKEVQGQQNAWKKHLSDHEQENQEIKEIFNRIKTEIYNGVQQTL